LKLVCGSHNHELANTLIDHPYAGRFTCSEKSILMDMINSAEKAINILLTMKEHNEKIVTTIKQVYNAQYSYWKHQSKIVTRLTNQEDLLIPNPGFLRIP